MTVATSSLGRWIGGLAHELGHALGLLHPPGCEEGLASCDVRISTDADSDT